MDKHHDIEFAELEFQPREVKQAYPAMYSVDREEIELDRVPKLRQDGMRRLAKSRFVEDKKSRRVGIYNNTRDRRGERLITSNLSTVDEEIEKDDISDKEEDEISDGETRSSGKVMEKEIV